MYLKYQEFSVSELSDKTEELLVEAVKEKELLEDYARGFLTSTELLNRLEDLKAWAEAAAPERLREGAESARAEMIGEAYAEAEGA